MNAPQERQQHGLTPEAAALVETYFARVHGALLVAAADTCEETVDDLKAHVMEELAETAGTPADVTRVLAELGSPETLAAECADIAIERPDLAEPPQKPSALAGTLLGIPYDLRPPTGDRVASRWWDPTNPHVLVPRVWGAGWDINFGAVAVKVGLIRPDDEDVPFAAVPPSRLALAWIVPAVLALAFVVLIALFQSSLPSHVPVHFGLDGTPDKFGTKGDALVMPVIFMAAGLAVCGLAWARRASALARVAAGAFALFLGSISLGVYAQHVLYAHGIGPIALFAGIIGSFVTPFLLLVGLSRSGRAAEMRRDLKAKGDAS